MPSRESHRVNSSCSGRSSRPSLAVAFSYWALTIFWVFARPSLVRSKSPMARAPSLWRIARGASALSWAVSWSTLSLPVRFSASCWTRAALMFGMMACRESNSPRKDAEILSRTSSVSRLLKDPKSAAICTTSRDMRAEASEVNPI